MSEVSNKGLGQILLIIVPKNEVNLSFVTESGLLVLLVKLKIVFLLHH